MPYESKPMKKQWIEVERKMTPIILPQIWSHEKQDWVVTSEQNPLPTQVTGSIVDLGKVENLTIPAGSTYRVIERGKGQPPIKELEIYFAFFGTKKISVNVKHFIEGSEERQYGLTKDESKVVEGSLQRDVIRLDAYGDSWRVELINNSEEEQEYLLFGVRGFLV